MLNFKPDVCDIRAPTLKQTPTLKHVVGTKIKVVANETWFSPVWAVGIKWFK